ncbi:glutaredoxin-C6-like [Rhodamnia argentea]|uniref:Glutaredoxin-C6-like n=1 Tax=Rhodamnia argentea TaxID=178133 RepID=A0A8B8QZM2_9MYRT|nr:glutaredoxin-C6-like [Rhodamnia argentea]XP_048133517.1 glutaredoxin-C6-like [Rhodamnia argentea]XP_048133518.1 glutaredoxin-C6-like [Rhodamnia argentea]
MQGLCSDDLVRLDLATPTAASASSLSIDADESAETRIQRLISEHPVIIFSRSSCCMCHVMRKLLASVGVNPTVIELDDDEIDAIPTTPDPASGGGGRGGANPPPAVFIGGSCVGGLESLVALHLSGHLVPKLAEVGVL